MARASAPTAAQRDLARQVVERQMAGRSKADKDKAVAEVAALIAAGHGFRD